MFTKRLRWLSLVERGFKSANVVTSVVCGDCNATPATD
jgi:hypothetical protein